MKKYFIFRGRKNRDLNFKLVIVDVTCEKSRFMKEEIVFTEKLKIPIMEVKFLENESSHL